MIDNKGALAPGRADRREPRTRTVQEEGKVDG